MSNDRVNQQTGQKKKRSVLKRIIIIIIVVIAAALVGSAIFMSIPMSADSTAKSAIENTGTYADSDVTVEKIDGKIAFIPADPEEGFIFYPGARVDPEAYAPVMQCLASRGVLCVVCPMPFNFALMGVNAADGVQQMFPQITTWYIGGHSLGGVAASMYVKKHVPEYEGLVLLASRSTEDLGNEPLRVLEVHGSEDGVVREKAMEEAKAKVPQLEEVTIQGGNHAQVGSYGKQPGDNDATISAEEQWNETADAIVTWMKQQTA
ncbi:MAG: alpha/beta hydrolase [Eubacterium sp.]|nr:alpha/beta hydrolase [Eubacterium sp.]